MRMQRIHHITQLKLDVDGLEFEILEGATNLLESDELKSVLVEDNSPKKGDKTDVDILMEKYLFFPSNYWGDDKTANKIYRRIANDS
jgi:hypothetical protein